MRILVLSAALVSILVVGASVGAASTGTTRLRATLNAKQQIPRQVVKAPAGSARFTGTLKKTNGGQGTLTWRLSYEKLSSKVTAAYIVVPPHGNVGQFVVAFCLQCKPNGSGVMLRLPKRTVSALVTRTAYVSIRTKKNPKGEIRGKLVVS